jgi:hypothetical protein
MQGFTHCEFAQAIPLWEKNLFQAFDEIGVGLIGSAFPDWASNMLIVSIHIELGSASNYDAMQSQHSIPLGSSLILAVEQLDGLNQVHQSGMCQYAA